MPAVADEVPFFRAPWSLSWASPVRRAAFSCRMLFLLVLDSRSLRSNTPTPSPAAAKSAAFVPHRSAQGLVRGI